MHVLYAHAIRYEWIEQSYLGRSPGWAASVNSEPLNVDQLSRLIYDVLIPRERMVVLLDFGAGLRRGELSELKWEDIDFGEKTLPLVARLLSSAWDSEDGKVEEPGSLGRRSDR